MKTNFLTNSNSKIRITNKKNNSNIYEFNLPAYKNAMGKLICPFAKDCIKDCYASKGTYLYKNVQTKYENNYNSSLEANFESLIQAELDKKKPSHVRIHSSGDFYNKKYLLKWATLAMENPDIIFYAYTKSIKFFKFGSMAEQIMSLDNFKIIFSLGSKSDNLINLNKDRHAKIFMNKSDLLNAGYIDASKNDLNAIANNKKVGLVFH